VSTTAQLEAGSLVSSTSGPVRPSSQVELSRRMRQVDPPGAPNGRSPLPSWMNALPRPWVGPDEDAEVEAAVRNDRQGT
jgi:hypothetical protein